MKHKVENLEGSLLDAAVAKAEGLQWAPHPGGCAVMRDFIGIGGGGAYELWSPSAEWEIGGPIMQRERITVSAHGSGAAWHADHFNTTRRAYGPTPLIAGMRAFVASRFGDEVELP